MVKTTKGNIRSKADVEDYLNRKRIAKGMTITIDEDLGNINSSPLLNSYHAGTLDTRKNLDVSK